MPWRPIFNRQVTIQSPAGTRDALGERATTWVDVATVWASITPLSVRDMLAAGQIHGEITHRVRVRHDSAIAAIDGSWRVLYGGRVLVIVGAPRNIDERDREIELICSEGVREE